MKKLIKIFSTVFLVFSMMLSTVVNTYAISNDSLICLVDSETEETIKNADVEIAILSKNEIITCESNDQGVLSLSASEVESLRDESLYVSVKGSYTGEIFTVIDNNMISVNRTLTRAVDQWNTISTEIIGKVWVPLTRLPTTDGLTTTFTLGKTSSFTLSGGGLSAVSFSSVTGIAVEMAISSTDENKPDGDSWMYVFGKVTKYKVTQETTTGQQRVIYGVTNNIESMTKRFSATNFAALNSNTAIWTFQKGDVGSYTMKRTQTTSFTLTGNLATEFGNFTSSFGGSSSKSSEVKHESNGKYKIYIAYNSVYSV